MPTWTDIDDPSDPRLADYVSLRDTQLRHSLEAEHGLFIAEGTKIIERALRAGLQPRSLLLAPRWRAGVEPHLDGLDVEVFVVSEALAEQVTGFHVHRGALGSFRRPAPRPVSDLLGLSRLVLVEDVVDHTNLGAIIRCAAGLGWDGVVVSGRAADPLYRRAIKTAMGTVFDLPWARMESGDDLAQLSAAGFETVALALREDALTLAEFSGRPRVPKLALMLGTEGQGLSEEWLARADHAVRIPMARGVDSLNVAAAAAIAAHALA